MHMRGSFVAASRVRVVELPVISARRYRVPSPTRAEGRRGEAAFVTGALVLSTLHAVPYSHLITCMFTSGGGEQKCPIAATFRPIFFLKYSKKVTVELIA